MNYLISLISEASYTDVFLVKARIQKQQGISFWIENKIISAYERSTEKSWTTAVLWSPIMYM